MLIADDGGRSTPITPEWLSTRSSYINSEISIVEIETQLSACSNDYLYDVIPLIKSFIRLIGKVNYKGDLIHSSKTFPAYDQCKDCYHLKVVSKGYSSATLKKALNECKKKSCTPPIKSSWTLSNKALINAHYIGLQTNLF